MNFLETIHRHKKDEIAILEDIPMPERSTRKLSEALSARTPCIIAEIKPMSPSTGKLMKKGDHEKIVPVYNQCADAISVLCDKKYFGGGYDLLASIRPQTHLPLLAKEFIIDRKQILHARLAGADAILLIANLITKSQIREFTSLAVALGMTILFEIHSEKEKECIPDLRADQMIIGINNRDLRTLEIATSTTAVLAPILRKQYPDHLIIAESGIDSIPTAQKLLPLVDGFLIGSGILKSTSPQDFLVALSSLSIQ